MIRRLRDDEPIPAAPPRRYLSDAGYMRLRWRIAPGQYVEEYEHRVVAGRPTGASVHHINGVRDDNRPENLRVVTDMEHGFEHRRIDDEQVAALYLSGMSTIDVGKTLGCHSSAVSRSLKRSGTPTRSISDALLLRRPLGDDIRELRSEGKTQAEIAEILGVGRSSVQIWWRKLGIVGKRGPVRKGQDG